MLLRKTTRLVSFIVVAAFAGWAMAGCSTTADLQPAAGAQDVPGLDEAARTSVDGVEVLAQVGEWPGPFPIKNGVTPIRVRIENGSGVPVAVRFSEFTLVGPQGERYSALPPFRIEGDVDAPVLTGAYSPITVPGFTYSGFRVATYYETLYPDIDAYDGPFTYDPLYYDTFTYWNDYELPTTEMLQRALPEGVISAGGDVEGWLYFERVPGSIPSVTFRADLVNARTGEEFGEIRIPFSVG